MKGISTRRNTGPPTALAPLGHKDADILPHTFEAGDPYYIGDVYYRFMHREDAVPYRIPPDVPPNKSVASLSTSSMQASQTSSMGPYHSHVRKLAREWIDMGYLAQWMEVTTTPTKMRFLNDSDHKERASRVKASVLDIGESVEREDFDAIEEFRKRFDGGDLDKNDFVRRRLIIVEDLSRDVIETLGYRFDIDPLFFRGQISDYTYYNSRDPWVELPEMGIVSSHRPFFHINYMQSRYFETQRQIAEAKREAGHFNVLRRLDLTGGFSRGRDIPGSDVALVRSKLSVWVRPPNPDQPGNWLGILLVDPPIKKGFPLWGGIRSFNPTPSLGSQISSGPPRKSIREDFAYWLTVAASEKIATIQDKPHGMCKLLISQIFKTICTEWLQIIAHATSRLTLLELEIERPAFLENSDDPRENTLEKLHLWRRKLPFFRRNVSATADLILKRSAFLSVPSSELQDLVPDLEAVQADFQRLITHSQVLQSFITASISYDEAKRATQQGAQVTKLTYIALIFAPLQFLSGLFSMVPTLGELNGTFKRYFEIAVPITVLLLLLARMEDLNKLASWIAQSRAGRAIIGTEKSR